MEKRAFQKYPRTPHLPGSGAVTKDDVVLPESEMWEFLNAHSIMVEEKIDGANVRIKWDGIGDLTVGNREHTLLKGYMKCDTPAKLQFRPMWNWIYENKNIFRALIGVLGTSDFTLYGEWMYAEHSVHYDSLPDLLIPFAIKFDDSPSFMDPIKARHAISEAGFCGPPVLCSTLRLGSDGRIDIKSVIGDLMSSNKSAWSSANREGIYIKCGDGNMTTGRYKYVDPNFIPVQNFTERGLKRNVVYAA